MSKSRKNKKSKKKSPSKKLRYEDKSNLIDQEIAKRSKSWFLTSVPWIDFQDVSQIIRTHIFRKWDQWDQNRPIEPWLNRIISNQLKNILRNYYSNFARPCLNCPFSIDRGTNACSFTPTKEQDSNCPLFAKWEKTKKAAYDIKIPVSLSGDDACNINIEDNSVFLDMEKAILVLADYLKEELTKKQYQVFDLLYIKNLNEEDAAKEMGYTTSETNRKLGYKQIKNIKRVIKEKTKKILDKKDVFY